MAQGTVKWFNSGKGFGFIECDEVDGDVFVHTNEVSGRRALVQGDKLKFDLVQGQKGPKAVNVKKISGGPEDWY